MALQDIFKNKSISFCDVMIIACVIAVSVAILIFTSYGNDVPTQCVIMVDGCEYATYSLVDLKEEKTVEIENKYGKNTILISRDGVCVTYSDCPDKLEVKSGEIKKAGQSLICLPHRLAVYLDGKTKTDVNAW